MRILGLVISLLFLMLAIGSSVAYFIDITSILIVFGIVIGARYFGINKENSKLVTIKNLFGYNNLEKDDRVNLSKELKFLARSSRYSGVIGTLVGGVIMLQNLEDPAAIGPALAVAIITMFYGICLSEMFLIPLSNKISNFQD